MMKRTLPNELVNEIKLFIRTSCEGCTDENSKHLNFHKTIITRYFEAKNVEVFYGEKKIIAQIPVGEGFTTINFGCLDLPTFLSSCVKEDQQSLDIYLNYMENLPKKREYHTFIRQYV